MSGRLLSLGRFLGVLVFLLGGVSLTAPRDRPPTASAPATTTTRERDALPGQLVVAFQPATSEATRDALIAARGGRTLKTLPGIAARLVALPAGRAVLAEAVAYAGDPRVRYAEPNFRVRAAQLPNDPSFGALWALRNTGQAFKGRTGTPGADIKAPAAWDVTTGSRDVVVGIIDTGIAYDHPDLRDNIWSAPPGWSLDGCSAGSHGYNALAPDCDPRDDDGHGTRIAGIIGATGNNGIGVSGVNWAVSLMGLKALTAAQTGTVAEVTTAIDYAVRAKRQGVNLRVLASSWITPQASQALLDAIRGANDEGILFVTAAGNAGQDLDTTPVYPAGYDLPNLLAVAATDNLDRPDPFSNYGTKVHLGAPGVDIYSTCATTCANGYDFASGTSLAAAYVAGAAALLLGAPGLGGLSVGQVKDRLVNCGDRLDLLATRTSSGRRLNVARAIDGCYRLTLTPSPGGRVTLAPPDGAYVPGTVVTLTASPDAGSRFSGWLVDGRDAGVANPLRVTMDADHSVRATFTTPPVTYTLALSKTPGGTIGVAPPEPTYPAGTTVTLTASPDPGYRFSGWTWDGRAAGTANPWTLTVNGNYTIRATFSIVPTVPPSPTPIPSPPPPPPVPTPTPTPTPRPVTPRWSGWVAQGGILTDAPAAVGFNGRVYLFARGTDNALYLKTVTNGIPDNEWRSLGGILTDAPAAATVNGVLYILAKGSDNALYVKSSTDGESFTDWRSLGGVLTAPPAAAGVAGVLYLFAKGSDDALYVRRSSDGVDFSDWQNLGGQLTAAPAATGFQGQVYVFAKGSDNALYEKHSADGVTYTAWRSYGGILSAAPAAASYTPAGGPETLYLFARGTDNALYERHGTDGAVYTNWERLGGQIIGPPAAAGNNGQVFAVVRWRNNTLYVKYTKP